jgi:hypothetical protein
VITGRELLRPEIEQIWRIDRSEVADNLYYLENGLLVLRSEHYDMPSFLHLSPKISTLNVTPESNYLAGLDGEPSAPYSPSSYSCCSSTT